MNSAVTRRTLLAGGLAAGTLAAAGSALALTDATANALITRVVGDINKVINSGKSESAMYLDFERIFERYADVDIIARSTLGPDARRATPAQLAAFAEAFKVYLARKYGKRFREFIGGEIKVIGSRAIKSYFEVETTAILRGQDPFGVVFRVSDRSGRDLFFDIVIEGISLGKTERTEIGAMLDKRRGDIDLLIADLKNSG